MYLITFSFEVVEEKQAEFVKAVSESKNFWKGQGFTFSLFRDANQKNRFLQMFLTERTVDELVNLIQHQPRAKAVFERMKDSANHVVISFMEHIL